MSSRDYAARARARLDEDSHASLFYAAFELRCGIEARLQEYLHAQRDVSKKAKKGWRPAVLGQQLERRFGQEINLQNSHSSKRG